MADYTDNLDSTQAIHSIVTSAQEDLVKFRKYIKDYGDPNLFLSLIAEELETCSKLLGVAHANYMGALDIVAQLEKLLRDNNAL